MDDKVIILTIFIGFIAIMSLITYILYAIDKRKAKRGKYRIPEKVLLLFSLFGGALGGYIAMFTLRHKTKGDHWYFSFINVVAIIIHIAIFIYLAFFLKI